MSYQKGNYHKITTDAAHLSMLEQEAASTEGAALFCGSCRKSEASVEVPVARTLDATRPQPLEMIDFGELAGTRIGPRRSGPAARSPGLRAARAMRPDNPPAYLLTVREKCNLGHF